jgi:DNA-directed RNA polymerase specialized sigma24 family protein
MKMLEKLDQWRAEATLAAWIRAVAYRTTVDRLRELKFLPLENDDRTENPDPIPEIFITELLEYLCPEQRLQVKLFFIEEWPPGEIAQFLKKDIGTVYVTKNRLLDKLRTICQKNNLL